MTLIAGIHLSSAAIYDFESVTGSGLAGQDGWTLVPPGSGETSTAEGLIHIRPGGGKGLRKLDGSGDVLRMRRSNDANFSFDSWSTAQARALLQFDVRAQSGFATIEYGKDTDGNPGLEQRLGLTFAFPDWVHLPDPNSDNASVNYGLLTAGVCEPNTSIGTASWYRIRMIIDFTSGGQIRRSVLAKNLSRGDRNFQLLGTPNVRSWTGVNPSNFNIVQLQSGGDTEVDNIVIASDAAITADPPFAVTETPTSWVPVKLKDFRPGSIGGSPSQLAASDKLMVFSASTADHGIELWKTDGSEAGTSMIADILPGSGHSIPNNMTPYYDGFLFAANDGVHGSELWKTDGTPLGTGLVSDLVPGGSGAGMLSPTWWGGDLFYIAWTAAGQKLARYKTNTGITLSNLNYQYYPEPDPPSALAATSELRNVNATFVMSANLPGPGQEPFLQTLPGQNDLWTSFGDVFPGSQGSIPIQFTAAAGKTWFAGFSSVSNYVRDLFVVVDPYGGSATKIALNGSSGSNPWILGEARNGLLFLAANSTGFKLWHSNGTSTVIIANNLTPPDDSNAPLAQSGSRPVCLGNRILFAASQTGTGEELWITDGTSGGTYMLKDIMPGSSGSQPRGLTFTNGGVMFTATTSTGPSLWFTDGSTLGTYQIRSRFTPRVWSGVPGENSPYFVDWNGVVYLSATDTLANDGEELWQLVPRVSKKQRQVAAGASFNTSVASPSGLGSDISLRGTSIVPTEITLSVNPRPPGDESTLASDLVELQGTSGQVFLLEISYDEATAISLFGSESELRLGWYDELADQWRAAVGGNTSASPESFIPGPFDGDLTPGRHGVDMDRNIAWAVLDHNSDFGVIASDPYQEWLGEWFEDAPELALPHLDADFDGFSNLEEFALGGNPRSPASRPTPVTFSLESGERVIFVPRSARRRGVTYQVQTSRDLGEFSGWSSANIETLEDSDTLLKVRLTSNPSGEPRMFARVLLVLD